MGLPHSRSFAMRRSGLFISSTGGISEIGWDLRIETSRKAEATKPAESATSWT